LPVCVFGWGWGGGCGCKRILGGGGWHLLSHEEQLELPGLFSRKAFDEVGDILEERLFV